jgi:hypothetical protein
MIDTAPRDGNVVILEDDAAGTYDVAHWSPEAGEWISESGEPSKITASHWHPMPSDKYHQHEDEGSSSPHRAAGVASRGRRNSLFPFSLRRVESERPATGDSAPPHPTASVTPVTAAAAGARTTRLEAKRPPPPKWRFATCSLAGALVAGALTVAYFHAEVTTMVTRYAGQLASVSMIDEEVVAQLLSPDANAALPSLQQTEANHAGPPTQARQATPVQQVAVAAQPEAQQSLEKEQRTDLLPNELAEARRAIEKLDVQLRAEAAKSAQSLEQERQKAAALAQEAAASRKELTAITAQHRQALEEERARGAALASELALARREIETNVALLNKARGDAAQFKQTGETATAELQQERGRVEAGAAKSAQLLGEERQNAAAVREELTASTVQHRQALDGERARSAALASELAAAQRAIETQAAQLRKASDETRQIKQAEAEKNAQSLEQERQKIAVLAQEAAAARKELTANTEQHRQALDEERARRAALWSELAAAQREIEVQAAQLRRASEETGQLKQATESATAELRQSLQQERDRAEAMARDLESARRTVGARVKPEPVASSQVSKAAQVVEVAAMAQPAVEAQNSPEAARLVARASALLGQGDIGAARTVLERAAETGSAQASFMLAETYDPGILSAWGTYGTQGEVTKARELYAKAHAGGIQEANDRFNALRQ